MIQHFLRGELNMRDLTPRESELYMGATLPGWQGEFWSLQAAWLGPNRDYRELKAWAQRRMALGIDPRDIRKALAMHCFSLALVVCEETGSGEVFRVQQCLDDYLHRLMEITERSFPEIVAGMARRIIRRIARRTDPLRRTLTPHR